jgi:HEAT repeat protein
MPELILALNDPRTRIRAARALGNIGPEASAAIPLLKRLLQSTNTYERQAAAVALHKMDPSETEAMDLLVGSLRSTNTQVKVGAASQFRDLGPLATPAIPDLLEAVRDTNSDVWTAALNALKVIAPGSMTNAVPLLLAKLDNTDPDRLNAAAWLLRINPAEPHGLAVMIGCLQANSMFETFAMDALAQIGTNAAPAIPALQAHLKHRDKSVRLAAAKALQRIQDPRAPQPAPSGSSTPKPLPRRG